MNTVFNKTAHIKVDASDCTGDLLHNWNYIGTDECNYIHTPEGEALLSEFGRFAEKAYYVRPHHLLCTGNCHGFYKWGSTNVYTEDKNGNPVYDFTTIDMIIDTLLSTGCKPFMELGFMPLHMVDPRFFEKPEDMRNYRRYQSYYWACPPKDYEKWRSLIATLVKHLVNKYGIEEVKTWYFELWNEPDLDYYWKGTMDEFCKLYDYTVAGIEDACPELRIGGPATTGPGRNKYSAEFLDYFLKHCRSGENYVSGTIGTRLDFVTFHVKGGGFAFDVHAQKDAPSVQEMVKQTQLGLQIIKKYGYEKLEIVLSEADPDGWAAGGIYDNANMYFRNTSFYPSFAASSFLHIQQLAEEFGCDVRPLTWAFVFRGERCFEGTRAFQTQGIDKPILNLFRMYALMGDKKLKFESDMAVDVRDYAERCGRGEPPEINGFAALNKNNSIDVLIYCHHDDWWNVKGKAHISLSVENIPYKSSKLCITHYRIDENHSNACTVWEKLGRPHYPSEEQKEQMRAHAGLEMLCLPQEISVENGMVALEFDLPVHGISLIRFECDDLHSIHTPGCS